MLKSSPWNREVLDRITVILGGLLLILFVVVSWLPQPCPIIKNWLVGCPLHTIIQSPQTAADKELARVPHQTITAQAVFFSTAADQTRNQARVNFDFQLGSSATSAYLKIESAGGYIDVGTVTNPLLTDLTWPLTTDEQFSLYQRVGPTYNSVQALAASTPPASQLLVDTSSARLLGLRTDQYTPLETATNLTGINYVVTTYHRPTPDGSWSDYTYTVDASVAELNSQKQVQWELLLDPSPTMLKPFYLGTIDVQYELSAKQ